MRSHKTPSSSTLQITHHLLGKGTQGHVVKGTLEGETVAVKIIMNENGITSESCLQEIAVLEELNKLNIPYVTHFKYTELFKDYTIIVMEYAENDTVEKHLNNPAFTLLQRYRVISFIAHALELMHENKMIHNDIKPENIFLTKDMEQARLGDFGSSRRIGIDKPTIEGTPIYMAPELLLGKHANNYKTDVYSFGIFMFEILMRTSAYDVTLSEKRLTYLVAQQKYRPSIHPLSTACPPPIAHLIQTSWMHEAKERLSMKDVAKGMKKHIRSIEKAALQQPSQEMINQMEDLPKSLLRLSI